MSCRTHVGMLGISQLGLLTLLACPDPASAPDAETPPANTSTSTAAGTATVTQVPAAPKDPFYEGLHYIRVPIASSLEASITAATDSEVGPALTQVIKRTLVWTLNPRRDIYPGDELELVFTLPPGEEPAAHAFWYRSVKHQKTFVGVSYKPEKSDFYRWFRPDGQEIEKRLKNGPLKSYEQVTSVLNDGRRHRGVDFKGPVGTPVYAPFDGVVMRKNWAWRANGTCLDIQKKRSNKRAFLLHLSSIARGLRPGSKVKKGQLVGRLGNTGRSTAPHLHYQLQYGKKGKIIDPFDFHETWRARLPGSELHALRALIAKYAKLRESVS